MRRTLTSALLAVLAIGVATGVTAVGVATTGTAAAGQAHTADSVLVQLTIDDASAAGIPGYSGVLGDVEAVPSEVVVWDKSDPDNVLPYLGGWYGGSPGEAGSTAQVDEPSGTHRGESTGSAVGIKLVPTADNLISFGSVHTWAQCTHAPAQETEQAYAASDSNQAYLFDDTTRPLQAGSQLVTTSGVELGIPGVGIALLTVTITYVEETSAGYAHAAVEVDVNAVLQNENGQVVYAGHLMDATLGEETVECESDTPPTTTTTPTTTSTTPTTTTTSPTTTTTTPTTSTTTSPTTTTTTPTTTSTTPTTTSTTPTTTTTTTTTPITTTTTSSTTTSSTTTTTPTTTTTTSTSPTTSTTDTTSTTTSDTTTTDTTSTTTSDTTTTDTTTTGTTSTGTTTSTSTSTPSTTDSSGMPGTVPPGSATGGGPGMGGSSGPSGPGLASTGFPLAVPTLVGLLLVGGGFWLLRSRRTRRSIH